MNNVPENAIFCTRFTAIKPARLSKRFTLTGDTLVKEGGGDLLEGTAEKLIVADLAEFAALLPTLTPRQALSYGINGHDTARVVTAAALAGAAAQSSEPVIARTRDHFTWPAGAGVLMLDYDAPPAGPALSADELRATLAAACPALADAPAVWRPSASSCIYTKEGAELRGIKGQRLYVAVADASDIPRSVQVLFDRLWLAGFGRYELSKSGSWLARSAIDASVAQPERLDFCGGAECGRGLEQRRPAPALINPAAPYLDTRAALPDLDAGERQRLAELREAAKEPLRAEQQRIREEWIKTRVDARLSALPETDRAEAKPKLERVYRQAAEGGRLGLDFQLVVLPKGARSVKAAKPVTVRELLDTAEARAKYNEATCLDPLEPDYPEGQGRFVGWICTRAREPYLTSQAHGGTRYTLGDAPAADEPPPLDEDYLDAVAQGDEPAKRKEAPGRGLTIECIPGALPEMVDQAEATLCKFEANFYQRSGQLVRWCVTHAETVKGITRPGGAVIILNQDVDYLLDRLNRLITWQRWNEKEQDYKACNAPRQVAITLMARRGHWRAQPLVSVLNAPTLRPDGSILDRPGYDAATGLLFVSNDVQFEPIPQHPTREHAAEALAFLYKEVLSGFPFAAPHDRSAALSAIITPTVRHSLKTAPMHAVKAPVMAAGKSLLVDVSSLIATGHPATVMSYTPDGDEMRKRVLSVLMQGDLVVSLDNVEEPLASQTLCSVLTQETFTDRILGVNKTGTAPTLCCWYATGNNLVIAGDLTTRVVPISLDPQVERPEEREFQRNLYDWIPAHRPRLIRAALTILRAYVVAGRPKQPIKNFARFEEWSNWIRAALVWLGEADPLLGRKQLEDGDPVRVKLRALLLAWFATFKTAPASAKEAKVRALETRLDDDRHELPTAPLLRETLEDHFTDRAGAISSTAIGYFLRQHAARIESGARFEAYGGNAARQLWRVMILDAARFKRACSATAKNTESGETSQTSQHPNPEDRGWTPPPEPEINELADDDPGLGCGQGWDACDSWDAPPNRDNFGDNKERF